jgi:iron complex outermembrane receptor protein
VNSLDIFGLSALSGDANWKVESVAAYGQVTYPLTEHWNFTIGARYTDEKYTMKDQLDPASPYNVLGLPNTGVRTKDSSKSTYNLKLDYRTEDWLAYATVSTGFKSGGLNPQTSASGPVEPEEITAYEVGVKSEWLDHRLRVNTAAYYYKYKQIQMTAYDAASGSNFSINAPRADVYGIDLDVQAVPIDALGLFAGITLLDTEIKGDGPISIGNVTRFLPIDGNHLPYAGDLKVNAGFSYRIVPQLTLSGTLEYSSGYWAEVLNRVGTGGSGEDDAFTTLALNLKYTSADERWYAALWGSNLFDEEYFQSGIVVSGFGESGVAAPGRQYGVRVGVSF